MKTQVAHSVMFVVYFKTVWQKVADMYLFKNFFILFLLT